MKSRPAYELREEPEGAASPRLDARAVPEGRAHRHARSSHGEVEHDSTQVGKSRSGDHTSSTS